MLIRGSWLKTRLLKKPACFQLDPIISTIHITHSPNTIHIRYISDKRTNENYYDLLKITPRASQDEIKSAYYKISKSSHPDLNTNKDAKTKFLQLNEAYKTLSNIRYRSDYDKQLFGSPHTPHHEFDAEFKDFLRRRDTFKKRSSTMYTGKTSHFDYEEFNRMHYGDTIRRNFEKKKSKQEWERQRKGEGMEFNTTFSVYCFIITSFITVFMISSKLS